MIKSILKYLLGLAMSIGIAYISLIAIQTQLETPKEQVFGWKWFMSVTIIYLLIVRPVCNYWSDIIYNLLDIEEEFED